MSEFSFNVLREPWIPAAGMDGGTEELGILSCLERAHEIKEIRDPAPIVEFGIYRLLVAFVLDTLVHAERRPEVVDDLRDLLDVGRFNSEMLRGYAEACGDVFDLFHPERPFLQCVMDDSKPAPLAGLYPPVSSGSNALLWHHADESEMFANSPEAVRLLTSIAPFMTAGGRGKKPSINGAPALYALSRGSDLFRTLTMNLPLRDSGAKSGVASWNNKIPPGEESQEVSVLEAMTWRARRIQLLPEHGKYGTIQVREMKFEQGDSPPQGWIDASLAYRYGSDKTTPVRMQPNRPVWLDAGPLALLNEREHGREESKVVCKRPDVVAQAFQLTEVSEPMEVTVYGMRTDMKMKVFEWTRSTLTIPAQLGRSTRLGVVVQREIDLAEKMGRNLRFAIKRLFPREGKGNDKALGAVSSRAERQYWLSLEREFYPLMERFGRLDDDAPDNPETVIETARPWRAAIRLCALDAFEAASNDLDSGGNALERLTRARSYLQSQIGKALS